MNQKTENGASFVSDLRDAATNNPVSAALIWVFSGC